MSDQAVDAPALPQIPRPTNARARRRSWAELPVRIWLILTVTIAAVTIWFTVTRVLASLDDRWLIEHGTPVVARFKIVNGDPVAGHQFARKEPLPCVITIPVNGVAKDFEIRLEPKENAFAKVGAELPIRIDPDNPQRWTERTQANPWVNELRMVWLLAPLAALLLLVTVWKRYGVLRVWRDQPLAGGVVVDVRHTAVAPLSRLVRFNFSESDDRRVHAALMPTRAGIPEKGQAIWLVCPPDKPSRAIVAELYREG
jgi:hypothetical protein